MAKTFEEIDASILKSSQKEMCVYCQVDIKYPKHEQEEARTETYYGRVTTQGTSSLTYPVKNYKVKFYEAEQKQDGSGNTYIVFKISKPLDQANKKDIVIENNIDIMGPYLWSQYTGDDKQEEQYIQEKEASEGIKYDYVYTLKCDYMEQAHRHNTPTAMYYRRVVDSALSEKNKSPAVQNGYRDSIYGFPCVLDKTDDGSGGTGNQLEAGTYMFNLDKDAASLGFEYSDNIKCISLEGSTQSDSQAAAFYNLDIYKDESFNSIYSYDEISEWTTNSGDDYVEKISKIIFGELPSSEQDISKIPQYIYIQFAMGSGTARKKLEKIVSNNFVKYKVVLETFKAATSSVWPAWTEPTGDEFLFDTYVDYVKETFDERYFYDENDKGKCFARIVRTIEWLSYTYSLNDNYGKFDSEFDQYFDKNYCLIYYLQMMYFAQTDNAGKNAMFDFWVETSEVTNKDL